jgi:hypothetical protein
MLHVRHPSLTRRYRYRHWTKLIYAQAEALVQHVQQSILDMDDYCGRGVDDDDDDLDGGDVVECEVGVYI